MASGGNDSDIIIWDVSSGEIVQHLPPGHDRGIWSLRFNDEGNRLLSADGGDDIILWRVQPSNEMILQELQENRYIRCPSNHEHVLCGAGDS